MKQRAAAPDSFRPITTADLASLPRRGPLAEASALEARGVAIEGHVQSMLRASDGDIHLDVAPGSSGPDGPLAPYAIAEITPRWRHGSRAWGYERLLSEFRPISGGVTRWERDPRRVRLSGWLLYDRPHEGQAARRAGAPAVASWEVHPVTKIELWDDSLRAFREYPR